VRRAPALVALLLAAAVVGCGGGGETPPTTPTTPPPTAGGGADPGVQVQRGAFEAGGGSGIVASRRYPGVLWAIRDRGGQSHPGKPQNALYAYKVTGGRVGELAGGASFKAVPLPVPDRDWEDIGRDREGNLWVADTGNNECDRTDTAVLKVAEPDPAAAGPAKLLATYRYRFPDPPPGCAGRNVEAMFLVDDVPYLIDKAQQSTLYRFPRLDPDATVTLEKVGVLAGALANLSGADLSADRTRLAVDSHTTLSIYQTADPSPDGAKLVADLIAHPPAWTVQLAAHANVEGVAFTWNSHDLNLLAENRDVYFVPATAYER
jgi:hypothetical protein